MGSSMTPFMFTIHILAFYLLLYLKFHGNSILFFQIIWSSTIVRFCKTATRIEWQWDWWPAIRALNRNRCTRFVERYQIVCGNKYIHISRSVSVFSTWFRENSIFSFKISCQKRTVRGRLFLLKLRQNSHDKESFGRWGTLDRCTKYAEMQFWLDRTVVYSAFV